MHRKTREIPWGQIIAGFFLFVMATMILVGLSWLGSPASASTSQAASPSHSTIWWDGYTCKAFWVFEGKPSPERFRNMVRASRHADTYLRSDVGLWNADVHRQAGAAVLSTDRGYVADDCMFTGDEGD